MIFDKRAVFIHIIIFSFVIVNVSSAGTMIDDGGTIMYANDYGEIAKDTWVWIDTDKDSIAECYDLMLMVILLPTIKINMEKLLMIRDN